MKRVLSGSGNSQEGVIAAKEDICAVPQSSALAEAEPPLPSPTAMIVEVEPEESTEERVSMSMAMPMHMQLIAESNETYSSSSLSDGSVSDKEMDDGDDQGQPSQQNTQTQTVTDAPSSADANADPSPHSVGMKRNANFQRMDSTNDSTSDSQRASSQTSSRDWGWFEDVHQSGEIALDKRSPRKPAAKKKQGLVSEGKVKEIIIQPGQESSAGAVTAPNYVLEESLSSQKLWKHTAGNRPPQPVEERAFFEKMWAQNFQRSQVEYKVPVEVLTAASPINMSPFADGNFDTSGTVSDVGSYNLASVSVQQDTQPDGAEAALVFQMTDPAGGTNQQAGPVVVNKTVKGSASDGDMTVRIRGDNVFGTTVSKSFPRYAQKGLVAGVDTVNISVASYRVVESKKGKYAQFLVIYREGSIRDTLGVWKRYRDFEQLAQTVTQSHEGCASVIANMSPLHVTEEAETEHLPNAITSWRLLKKRQRWYRCLDAGYLSLKVFLLERFLHDILFESTSPQLLREFVRSGEEAADSHIEAHRI